MGGCAASLTACGCDGDTIGSEVDTLEVKQDKARGYWIIQQDDGSALGVKTHDEKKSLSSDYKMQKKELGSGAYGKVKFGLPIRGAGQRAIKEVRKKNEEDRRGMSKDAIKVEVDAMASLDNPHIIRLFEVFQDRVNVYLVMEYCAGGDVCDAIQAESSFTEKIASNIMKQVANGVAYMHRKHICHRDLKPDNFLLQDKNTRLEHNHLKIVDFGCAWHFKNPDDFSQKKVGSQFYIAPEVIRRKYQCSCDVWSCGVTMYILLSGFPPFRTESEILANKLTFPSEDWCNVSDDAKELIKVQMQVDVSKRWSMEQVLEHVWIDKNAPKSRSEPLKVQTNMLSFCQQNGMKKAALNIVARNLSDQQIEGLRTTFSQMDKNQDGTISRAELEEALQAKNMGDSVKQVLEGLDTNGDGTIEYTEFLAGSLEKKQYTEEGACWSAFKAFDLDSSGTIARSELARVLQHDDLKAVLGDKTTVDELFSATDTDNDGVISWEEFLAMMRKG